MNRWQSLRGETRSSLSEYLSWITQHQGLGFPFSSTQTLGSKQEEIEPTFEGYASQLFAANPIVFACVMLRLRLFSEARFQFKGRRGDLFGTEALRPLEEPWPEASTTDLLSRMALDADLAGNFFGVRHEGRIMPMRPDWVTIVLGSRQEPRAEIGAGDLGVEPVGYIYEPGGKAGGGEPVALLAEDVAHFAPIPDPLASFRGKSWLQPIIRDVMGDQAGTEHKLKYLEKGASPNAVIKAPESSSPEGFERFKELFEESRKGNPYGPLFLGGGADYEVVGSDMRKIDFKAIQALGENRICVAAGIPAIVVGVSAGLEASTFNNVGQAKRLFADANISPMWKRACEALAPLIKVPPGAELWYDDRAIPFLQEDRKDEAEILQAQAATANVLVEAGYEPDSITAAIIANDMSLLVHSGLVSIQLQVPGTQPSTNGSGAPANVPVP